jgi:uncharacterized protein (TIRG00374 family)
MNQWPKILLSIAFAVALIGIWLHIVDLSEVLIITKRVRIEFIFPLAMSFLLMYFIRSIRWKIILSPIERITTAQSFNLCMTNYLINFLVPVHAGELVKSVLLKKIKGTPVSKSLPTVYLDKVTEVFPFFFLLAATPFLAKRLSYIIYLTSGLLLIILVLLVLFLCFLVKRKDSAVKLAEKVFFFLPLNLRTKLAAFVDLFVDGTSSIIQLSGRLLEILGLTILAVSVHCTFMWLFFYSFGIKLPLLTVIVGYLLLNASFILPAPPGFAGSLELSFLFIFAFLFGYDKNIVSAIAASSHIFMAVLFGLTGATSMACIGARLSNILRVHESKLGLGELVDSD